MISVLVKNAQQALALKQQVIDGGLVLHEDFTWEYRPNPYNGYNDIQYDSLHTHPEVRFIFRDPGHETFFRMRFDLNSVP